MSVLPLLLIGNTSHKQVTQRASRSHREQAGHTESKQVTQRASRSHREQAGHTESKPVTQQMDLADVTLSAVLPYCLLLTTLESLLEASSTSSGRATTALTPV